MGNFNSANTSVFPSAFRVYGTASGKFTSEDNITGIVRAITDNDSYIISQDGQDWEFIIHGYYFKVNDASGIMPTTGDAYAVIYLDDSNRLVDKDGYTTLDNNNLFVGVEIVTSVPTAASASLQLIKDGEVCQESFIQFNANRIGYGDGNIKDNLDDLNADVDDLKEEIVTKQAIINEENPLPINYLKDNAGSTVLKVANGGTGQSNLDDVTVGEAKDAINVTTTINNKKIVDIFESNGTTVKLATTAATATTANKLGSATVGSYDRPIHLENGSPVAGRALFVQSSEPTSPSEGDVWIVIQ